MNATPCLVGVLALGLATARPALGPEGREVESYPTPGGAWAVTVAGASVYVADWHSGLRMVDFSVSSAP